MVEARLVTVPFGNGKFEKAGDYSLGEGGQIKIAFNGLHSEGLELREFPPILVRYTPAQIAARFTEDSERSQHDQDVLNAVIADVKETLTL